MKELTINEIVIFQFNKKDKNKIYAHARNSSLSLNIFSKENFLLGIYLPKKTITKADMILDKEDCENFLTFLRRLKNNNIKTHIKVFENNRYIYLD